MNRTFRRFRGFPPVFEKPSFIIIGMMRSGSNFLERQLNLYSDLLCHGELLNRAFIGFSNVVGNDYLGYTRNEPARRDPDVEGFLREVERNNPRRIMGFRAFVDHHDEMIGRCLYDPDCRKVVLTRNLLESFVSLEIARITDQWLVGKDGTQKKAGPIHVEIGRLIDFSLKQTLFYNDITATLRDNGQDYALVDYEELQDVETINRIAAFVGSDIQLETMSPQLFRQNPGPIRDKVENYDEVIQRLRNKGMARWFI